MSVLRMPATVRVTDRMIATSRMRPNCCESRRGICSVSPATSMEIHSPSTIDQRIEGTRTAWASEDQPFGAWAHRRMPDRSKARTSSAIAVAATNRRACHTRYRIALHAIVVPP